MPVLVTLMYFTAQSAGTPFTASGRTFRPAVRIGLDRPRVESNNFGGTVFTQTQAPTSQVSYPQGPAGSAQAPSILGNWQTSSDGTPIRRDGTFTAAGSGGRSRELNSNDGIYIYELTWSDGSADRVRLSADGHQLEDSSPGVRLIATRVVRGQRRNRDAC